MQPIHLTDPDDPADLGLVRGPVSRGGRLAERPRRAAGTGGRIAAGAAGAVTGRVRPALAAAKSKLIGAAAKRAVAWQTKRGKSPLALLPASATMPLRRNGLDPLPELSALRADTPVAKLPLPFGVNVFLVSGYQQAKQVLADTETFSNDFANIAADESLVAAIGGNAEEKDPGGLGMADPPDHTRLRKILTPEFTMRRLSRLTPRLEEIVQGQLDEMEQRYIRSGGKPIDLCELFSLPIPSLAICELLGVPYEDREAFQRLSVARFDLFAGAGASLGAISESLDYLMGVVAQQRKEPGDGLLGMIIREHGDAISDRELAGLADGILVGGFETTASMIALGALVLLRDPLTRDRIGNDPAAIAPFVEELLRYLTVVQVAFPRFARVDCEVDGVRIGKGDVVLVSLSAADRDPALVADDRSGKSGTAPSDRTDRARIDLDRIDLDRAPTKHLAFGHGAHRCIGAELGRMELRIAYPALVKRFPNLRLATPPEELDYRQTSIVYGVEQLPVHLN